MTTEVNFPETVIHFTLSSIELTRFFSRQVNEFKFLEHNFTDLKPGTTYKLLLEPRFGNIVGDPAEIVVTTRLAELNFECFEILEDDLMQNSSSQQRNVLSEVANADEANEFINDLEKYTSLKCIVSIDGRFDNVTITSEPPFRVQFQVFSSNYLEYEFTKLTPGETYRYSAIIEAGPWTARSSQEVPTIPSRPVLLLFKVYIDNSIEIGLLLNGKGVSFTYELIDKNVVVRTLVESFEKYKFLLFDPNSYGMTLKAFVSSKEHHSKKAEMVLKEVNFFNVNFESVLFDSNFHLLVNYTVNSLDFDYISVKMEPDPNPGLKKFYPSNTTTSNFWVYPYACGRKTEFSMVPYADYSTVGPEFKSEINLEPCALFSLIQDSVTLYVSEEKAEISITIPFRGEVADIELHFTDKSGILPDFDLKS